jgi:hypothetical protein
MKSIKIESFKMGPNILKIMLAFVFCFGIGLVAAPKAEAINVQWVYSDDLVDWCIDMDSISYPSDHEAKYISIMKIPSQNAIIAAVVYVNAKDHIYRWSAANLVHLEDGSIEAQEGTDWKRYAPRSPIDRTVAYIIANGPKYSGGSKA